MVTRRLLVEDPTAELIVLSHVRWDFVWQRPQHLVSRLSERSHRTVFVEEPTVRPTCAEPVLRTASAGNVARAWLEVPGDDRHCGFGDAAAESYGAHLGRHLGRPAHERIVWLYTPMALPIAKALHPDLLVYDVMDDLASFAHAPVALRSLQAETLRTADVVFTGGRSLQRSVVDARPDAHCFPSGVEPAHYERARSRRREHPRPVAGYVGVVDERLDLELLAGLAAHLPGWDIQVVGPVLKIDPRSLPQAPNLHYPGPCEYQRLPEVMAGFDVALMPFALNEATRSISPTKMLEYLAAGLPVVSTPVPDVVASYSDVVDVQLDAAGVAQACRRVIGDDLRARDRKVRPLLQWNNWDTIADRMAAILDGTDRSPAVEVQPA